MAQAATTRGSAAPDGGVVIDGSHGEGGGQVLRTALALSIVTGRRFHLRRARANRAPTGLRPQHVMAVRAAAAISGAEVEGAAVGAESLSFRPGPVRAGHYEFDIGTAGSTTLVLQTVLMPLLLADGPSTLVIEGGTHNQHAPPVEFLADTFLPLLRRIGGSVDLRVERYGTWPRGGGRIDVAIEPIHEPAPLRLVEVVQPRVLGARALVVGRVPDSVAERELAVVAGQLDLPERALEVVRSERGPSTGNALVLSIDAGDVVETVSSVGQRGLPAEDVALAAVQEARAFMERGAPVGEHLADQLLLPMVLASGGAFRTGPLSLHATTNIDTIGAFVDASIRSKPARDGTVLVEVDAAMRDTEFVSEHDVRACGLDGAFLEPALQAARTAARHRGRELALADLVTVLDGPERNHDHPEYGDLARALGTHRTSRSCTWIERREQARYASWCADVEEGAARQMQDAMRLPSAVSGALMPDAHRGYGLPIGGVLSTEGTVIPYAVGVDIACRMRLSVLDLDAALLDRDRDRTLEKALLRRTRFGAGGELGVRERRDHPVLDRSRWEAIRVTAPLRDRAWAQLGTSGSGNHFVEFGLLTLGAHDLGLRPGRYLALLSHSGSRGAGAQVAQHFTRRARAAHPELPAELEHLAWLDLDDDAGREYWAAMELMGEYAAACHEVIHERVLRFLNATPLAVVENHHNFAWRERHGGRDVVVHRKGATPAGEGVLGVIPGSMASPAFVVRGKGNEASLRSASHGAGRVLSRSAAKRRFTWQDVTPLLRANNVRLLSAGIDENPLVYKDIHHVMAQQRDLVDVVARFEPRIVRMDSR